MVMNALLLAWGSISLFCLRSIWRDHPDDSVLIKLFWSLVVCVPIMG
ncbi:MAG TPA: hypothetical protein PKM88_10205 [bacterium]|nr:hypothetical protein [bacterium]